MLSLNISSVVDYIRSRSNLSAETSIIKTPGLFMGVQFVNKTDPYGQTLQKSALFLQNLAPSVVETVICRRGSRLCSGNMEIEILAAFRTIRYNIEVHGITSAISSRQEHELKEFHQ